ncbi:MAG: hypothetical protein JXB26_12915, partial [Candidatus Aminicenantes bacterium]|nr:hypothetical protein [Candidatus Aminicenantes bacterium]
LAVRSTASSFDASHLRQAWLVNNAGEPVLFIKNADNIYNPCIKVDWMFGDINVSFPDSFGESTPFVLSAWITRTSRVMTWDVYWSMLSRPEFLAL